MNKTDLNTTSENILVLGAGELGLPVLRNLAPGKRCGGNENQRAAARKYRNVR